MGCCPRGKCPDTVQECLSKNIEFGDDLSCRMGYAHKIYIVCRDCSYKESTCTSKQSQKVSKSQVRRKVDINIRIVGAFCEIGKGLEGIQNVTRCLNMLSVGDPRYQAITEELLSAYEYAANKSTTKAAIEVSAKAHDVLLILTDAGLVNCEVSFDCSWQKRGH